MTKNSTRVAFLNLKRQYLAIKPEIDAAISNVIEQCAFSAGPFVTAFEARFAELHQLNHCIAMDSGTAALHVSLLALGIGPGDEVIVPANTFFATAEAVSLVGARPVFVDCDPQFYNIDASLIKRAITPKTKAVIAVHLYGQPADLKSIHAITERHGLLLLEDCAQAHCAEFEGSPVGRVGVCGCFSFYPGKNLGAYGEGGAVVTSDPVLANKIRALINHGSSRKYFHDYVGLNYRMDGFQGAILEVKTHYIHEWTQKRQAIAQRYRNLLADVPEIVLPQEFPNATHVYHLFVIQAECRDELSRYLELRGIATGIHYPLPCHLQQAYVPLGYTQGAFPVAEKLANHILSLPMFPELADEEIQYVSQAIHAFYDE